VEPRAAISPGVIASEFVFWCCAFVCPTGPFE